MKKFNEDYKLLESMYKDSYFPDFLVDKIKFLAEKVIEFLDCSRVKNQIMQSLVQNSQRIKQSILLPTILISMT